MKSVIKLAKGSLINIFQDPFNKLLSQQLTHDRSDISQQLTHDRSYISQLLTHDGSYISQQLTHDIDHSLNC